MNIRFLAEEHEANTWRKVKLQRPDHQAYWLSPGGVARYRKDKGGDFQDVHWNGGFNDQKDWRFQGIEREGWQRNFWAAKWLVGSVVRLRVRWEESREKFLEKIKAVAPYKKKGACWS